MYENITAEKAIKLSTETGDIVHVLVDDAADYRSDLAQAWHGDVDDVEAGTDDAGRRITEVWGWDKSTAEGRSEWRVHLHERTDAEIVDAIEWEDDQEEPCLVSTETLPRSVAKRVVAHLLERGAAKASVALDEVDDDKGRAHKTGLAWVYVTWPLTALCCDDVRGPLGQPRIATSANDIELDAAEVGGESHAFTLLRAAGIEADEVYVHRAPEHTTIRYRTATQYRIVYGETGSEIGHVDETDARTEDEAREALEAALEPYGGDGWGRIEWLRDGGWDHTGITMGRR